jgi:hypothetical protein
MISLLTRVVVGRHARLVPAAVITSTRAFAARYNSSSLPTDDRSSGRVMREPPHDSLLSFSTQFYRHPSAPFVVGWVDLETPGTAGTLQSSDLNTDDSSASDQLSPMEMMNRNARKPKRANRGKRAVSRQARRAKKRAIGNHRR